MQPTRLTVCLGESLSSSQRINDQFFFCWLMQVRYNEYWHDLFADCYAEPSPVLHRGGTQYCIRWRKFYNVVTSQVRREITIFSRFGEIVEEAKGRLRDCRHCEIRADRWTQIVQRNLYRDRKSFTFFLT